MATTIEDSGDRSGSKEDTTPRRPTDPKAGGGGFADEDDDAPTAEQRAAAHDIARERRESPAEGAVESMGRAIGEALTGADQTTTPGAAPTKPANR